jgi:acyl-CoA oxidase
MNHFKEAVVLVQAQHGHWAAAHPLLPYVYYAASAFFVVYITNSLSSLLSVDDGSMDKATEDYLVDEWSADVSPCYASGRSAPKMSQAMVRALEDTPFTHDEGVCAKQMQMILKANHIPYSSLVDAPENLLRVSPGCERQNGALWTRFTVQYNLFAGSIVALGSDEQREELISEQLSGRLGCFSFTEKGTGVLSGAGVETTATFDAATAEFVINSPNKSSCKNWISQGMYAEEAVILADLIIDGERKGPHLFWARIADAAGGKQQKDSMARPTPRAGVTVDSNPDKTCMHGLDNATMSYKNFRVPLSGLLSRFCEVTQDNSDGHDDEDEKATGSKGKGRGSSRTRKSNSKGSSNVAKKYSYRTKLPKGSKRMLDILIFRLLTGRIVLSEATMSFCISRLRRNWQYAQQRELWRGRKEHGPLMSDMVLVKTAFRDYGRTAYIVSTFIAVYREKVADSIRKDHFSMDTIEATCMCKFLGTGFGLDLVDAVRKVMGARGLQADSWLGADAFLPLATCAAEGDNTIMELKILQDLIRGKTSKFPLGLMMAISGTSQGRTAVWHYNTKLARAMLLGAKALKAGQLLRDIAWARAHMRVIATWLLHTEDRPDQRSWLSSYESILMRFPTPTQH